MLLPLPLWIVLVLKHNPFEFKALTHVALLYNIAIFMFCMLKFTCRANHDVIDAIDKARVVTDCLPQVKILMEESLVADLDP